MKRLAFLCLLLPAACQSSSVPAAGYLADERSAYEALAPAVARDVTAGHQETGRVYRAWGASLQAAERATGATTQP